MSPQYATVTTDRHCTIPSITREPHGNCTECFETSTSTLYTGRCPEIRPSMLRSIPFIYLYSFVSFLLLNAKRTLKPCPFLFLFNTVLFKLSPTPFALLSARTVFVSNFLADVWIAIYSKTKPLCCFSTNTNISSEHPIQSCKYLFPRTDMSVDVKPQIALMFVSKLTKCRVWQVYEILVDEAKQQ